MIRGISIFLVMTLAMAAVPALSFAEEPIKPVLHVDLPRFMGRWYVVAAIPTRFEKNAYKAVQTYSLQGDNQVTTSLNFRNGAPDGPEKSVSAPATVQPGTGNAVWAVKLFWLMKAQYKVAYLADDYSQMIVARDARDYVWVMSRTPYPSQGDYDALIARVGAMGYSTAKIRRIPQ
ncbi:lipocalin family protein [Pinirhizobacter sp.]|jgi:apolipoprotein D and lipocalin family protein|uniref:lipocalin family protein n=1 Tax=Pinirhizobacter sp. TaxID=2950432 RepID=UPI002F417C30